MVLVNDTFCKMRFQLLYKYRKGLLFLLVFKMRLIGVLGKNESLYFFTLPSKCELISNKYVKNYSTCDGRRIRHNQFKYITTDCSPVLYSPSPIGAFMTAQFEVKTRGIVDIFYGVLPRT